jgi:hypothetical protein
VRPPLNPNAGRRELSLAPPGPASSDDDNIETNLMTLLFALPAYYADIASVARRRDWLIHAFNTNDLDAIYNPDVPPLSRSS